MKARKRYEKASRELAETKETALRFSRERSGERLDFKKR